MRTVTVDGDGGKTGHPLEEDELKRCPEFHKEGEGTGEQGREDYYARLF